MWTKLADLPNAAESAKIERENSKLSNFTNVENQIAVALKNACFKLCAKGQNKGPNTILGY